MKKTPHDNAPLETECLFGESVQILEKKIEWIYCKLLTDSYCGWIKKDSVGHLKKPTHRVAVKRTFVYEKMDPKSNCLLHLPMGSRISVTKKKSEWSQTCFVENNKPKIGYIPNQHIVFLSDKIKDWVSTAEMLEGIPYKWGGRDTLGIDCSALLQLSYQSIGEYIPRNTSQQINLQKEIIHKTNNLKRGYVIFWEGHVGIMIDKLNCIHANAFHMKTVKEPLHDIIERMGKDNQIKRIMNFNVNS